MNPSTRLKMALSGLKGTRCIFYRLYTHTHPGARYRFLTHRSVGGVATLEQKVVDSSPILESFGNAKTLRNNNSSRFGKFLKLQFTKDEYRLTGAFVETYLLEKSRVLRQGQGERNFHVLYELVAGAAKNGLAKELMVRIGYKKSTRK